MKYNLKNWPSNWITTRCQEWFEGFEKQEKVKEKYLRFLPEATLQHLRDKVGAYERHMKEILGE